MTEFDPAELARLAEAVNAKGHGGNAVIETAEYVRYVTSNLDAIVAAVDLAHDEHWLIGRQSQLLTDAVNVMRGDPPPLTTWGHADVADLARALIAERDKARAALRRVEALADDLARWQRLDGSEIAVRLDAAVRGDG